MAYTTSWRIILPAVAAFQAIQDTSTTQKHNLGTIVQAEDRGTNGNGVGEFIYALGVASTVAGSFVIINEDDYSTNLLAASAIGQVGIAMSANVANQYGWYQIKGKAVGKSAGSVSDNANVYATSTAGQVSATVVAGDRVKKCKYASASDAPATGFAEFEIDRPWNDAGLAA